MMSEILGTSHGRPLTVLFLIDTLRAGGAEQSLAEMLPGLASRGITPIVTCLRRSNETIERVTSDRFEVRFLGEGGPFARVRSFRRIIQEVAPDLVHTTLLESDLIGRLAAVGTKIVVLSSLVNTPYVPIRFEDPRIRPWVFRSVQAIDGWTSRHLTTHFHAITEAVKSHYVEELRVRDERITVIPRGRDPVRMGDPSLERRESARRALGLRASDEVLVHVGRQEYQKGHRFLLEALELLSARRPRLVLLMAGRRGAASSELDELVKRPALVGRVNVLGQRDDVPEILAAGDVFVFPSLFEGLGGSLIEAMALGLPIVASQLDAIQEVVDNGKNATLVPPASSEALAAAIEDLLDDRAKASAFAVRSRQLFEADFTLELSIERMAALYRLLLEAAPAWDAFRVKA